MSAFIAHFTLDHLARLSQPDKTDLSERTPALRAVVNARAKGYDGICLPLTTEKWRTRWKDLCLLSDDESPDKAALEQRAEEWRANPVFARDEVTITRLGAQQHSITSSQTLTFYTHCQL